MVDTLTKTPLVGLLMFLQRALYFWPRLMRKRYGHVLRAGDVVTFRWADSICRRFEEWPPYAVAVADPLNPSAETIHAFQRREVLLLKDAIVDPVSATVRLRGAGIAESTPWNPEKRFFRMASLPTPLVLDGEAEATFLVSTSWNYYHFLIEDLPVVLRARPYASPTVVLGFDAPRFVVEALEMAGLSYVRVATPRSLGKAWVPTRGNDVGWPHKQDVGLMRSQFCRSHWKIDREKRIYVSRRFSRRALPDERRLEEWLETRGFLIVYCEQLSFPEQVRLFAEASLIVGPHGAGLANIVFSSNEARLLELCVEDFVNGCIEAIAQEVGMGFSRVILTEGSSLSSMLAKIEAGLEVV